MKTGFRIWVRSEISPRMRVFLGIVCAAFVVSVWFAATSADVPERRMISRNVLPNPFEVVASFPRLVRGGSDGFSWPSSLGYAALVSLRRESIAFIVVIATAIPLGIAMSAHRRLRAFFHPLLIIGSFIPIAALLPLTYAFFGIGEIQKVVFLSLGMFFMLTALVAKEMDEVDEIFLQTAYTLGFSQFKTVLLVNFPIALSRIWKHLSSVFGLGWGYIIFAEMVNSSGGTDANGIGWLFIARQRRNNTPEMYAIFFVIIALAFFFSWCFKTAGKALFKYDKDAQ